MSDIEIITLRVAIATVGDRSIMEGLFLPKGQSWDLDTPAVFLMEEEVPPELENEPDAGIPQFARDNNFQEVMEVSTLQQIVENARMQRRDVSIEELFEAFEYYVDRDAFIEFR